MFENTTRKGKNVVFSIIELSQMLDDSSESNITDLIRTLKEKCLDENIGISSAALWLLTGLVERGKLTLPQCLSTMVSLVSSHPNPHLLVATIGNLLVEDASVQDWTCPYDIGERPHPFITTLKHSWNNWGAVSAFIHSCLHDPNNKFFGNTLSCFLPVTKLVFLDINAPYLAKFQMLSLFLHLNLLEEIILFISWQQLDYNWCCLVQEILFRSVGIEKRHKIVKALTPAAAEAVVFLVTHGYSPDVLLGLIYKCLEVSKMAVDPVLNIIADALYDCPSVYLLPLTEFCYSVMSKYPSNALFANKVSAALLCWAIYPSPLTFGLPKVLKHILKLSRSKMSSSNSATLFGNNLFTLFSNSSPAVRSAVEMSILADNWRSKAALVTWLAKLDSTKHKPTLRQLFPVLCAIGLQAEDCETSDIVFRLLFQIVSTDVSFNILCLLLYKIGQEVEPTLQLKYLKLLPKMAVDKENIPLILGTIDSLQKGSRRIMIPLRMSLLMDLWNQEPRTFPYLQRILEEPVPAVEEVWEIHVARAMVLRDICNNNPSQHGKDLVGLLSGVLNSCGDDGGARPSAIAIDAITELCRAHVVDIKGTWSALEPKMGRNRQPVVVSSICRLLGEMANFEGNSVIAIPRLWAYVTSNIAVAAALTALGNFAVEDFSLKAIPEAYRKGLTLPAEVVKTAVDAAQRPEDILSYVPGDCWVLILVRIPKKYQSNAEEMLAAILKKEVAAFPRGIYHLPAGQNEPTSFSYLPPSSILRGLTGSLQNMISADNLGKAQTVLTILSRDYNRPLPHINWTFLESTLKRVELKNLTLSLLAHQGPVSVSARKLLQEYIPTVKWNDKQDVIFAMGLLPSLCRSLPPTIMHPFISANLQACLESILRDDTGLEDFSSMIDGVRATIALGMVPEPNQLAVFRAIEEILARPDLPAEHPVMKVLANCAADFPEKVLDRLTSPLLWWEVTSHRIRQALAVRANLAIRPNISNPLVCFNEIIDAALPSTEDHGYIIRVVLSVVVNVRSHPSCCSWLLHLLGRVTSSDADLKGGIFLLDLMMSCVVGLSGRDHLLIDCEMLAAVREHRLRLFPLSLNSLFKIKDPDWSSILPSFVEGIHRVLRWAQLSSEYHEAVYDGLLALRSERYCAMPAKWPRLYSISRNKHVAASEGK